jgi:deoxyribodipyrimidine photo-lyase
LADLGPSHPPEGVTATAVGERAAHRSLNRFLRDRLSTYAGGRNRPQGTGGSRLSPYLRYGLIGPRDFVWKVRRAAARSGCDPAPLLREFAFREYYAHQSSEWRTPTTTRDAERDERGRFEAWRWGRTGYPFVDAAMRELSATGWISNRARLIVSAFLIQDLRLDFRLGERHFLQTLVDADPASNRGNWRWSAGIGPDAPPPWRALNPVTQAKRYDPDGSYTRRWTPEVARMPNRFVHEPWNAPATVQREVGCVLDRDYPLPIVPPRNGRSHRPAAV